MNDRLLPEEVEDMEEVSVVLEPNPATRATPRAGSRLGHSASIGARGAA
jgi:hypothetical protein